MKAIVAFLIVMTFASYADENKNNQNSNKTILSCFDENNEQFSVNMNTINPHTLDERSGERGEGLLGPGNIYYKVHTDKGERYKELDHNWRCLDSTGEEKKLMFLDCPAGWSLDGENCIKHLTTEQKANLQAVESNSVNNKAVAEFGELVVSKAFTYAKEVKDVNGHKIVDVVILDKLCHVTVEYSSGEMRASKIECDEGRHFGASSQND